MNKLLFTVCVLCSITAFAQNIKNKNLEYQKVILPLMMEESSPLDMDVMYVSDSPYVNESLLKGMPNKRFDFINYNNSDAKYYAIVEFVYKEPYTFTKQESSGGSIDIAIRSNMYANLYLLEVGKGIFSTEQIELTNPNNTTTKNGYRKDLSAAFSGILPSSEAAAYFVGGKFPNPAKVLEIELEQKNYLVDLVGEAILDKMVKNVENKSISFDYLKLDKKFDSGNFDALYTQVKENINPVNKEVLRNVRQGFLDEYAKYEGNQEKAIMKYKGILMDNVLRLSFLIDDYKDVDSYVSKINVLGFKDSKLTWINRVKKDYEYRQSKMKVGKTLVYSSIPDQIVRLTDNDERLKKSKVAEEVYIANVDDGAYDKYIDPVFMLNELLYELELLKNINLLPRYQNDLFNDILEVIVFKKNAFYYLNGSEKKEFKEIMDFGEQLKTKAEKEKWYSSMDSMDHKLSVLRKYVAENYKIEDFTKYIPSLQSAVALCTKQGKDFQTQMYRDAVNMSASVQMRNFIADDFYLEDERKQWENSLDSIYEKRIKEGYMSKVGPYYAFKTSQKVFDQKRALSDQEYKNYKRLLMQVVAHIRYN